MSALEIVLAVWLLLALLLAAVVVGVCIRRGQPDEPCPSPRRPEPVLPDPGRPRERLWP